MSGLIEFATYKELKPLLASMKTAEGRNHPVLAELDMTMFRGARCWALLDAEGQAFHIHAAKFGKRKKNKWEPYCNWYIAYTRVDVRRQGHARWVADRVRDLAREAGCVRLKSLAGTYGGLRLHLSLGDQCWGMREGAEVVVDTPLVAGDWTGVPPNAVEGQERKMPLSVLRSIKSLRYDHMMTKGKP